MQVIKTLSKKAGEELKRAASEPQWKQSLRDGHVLIVDKRPNWSVHENTVLKSKKVEDGIAIWLEQRPLSKEVLEGAALPTSMVVASGPPNYGQNGSEEPPPPEEPSEAVEDAPASNGDLSEEAAAMFMSGMDGEE